MRSNKKNIVAVFGLFLLLAVKVNAQSADAVSSMIETPAVRYSQATYFMATAVDPNFSTEEESLEFCIAVGLCNRPSSPDKLITMSEFAGLCMRTFNLKGGILYSLTRSNHYAFREMQAKGFISKNADPSATITGSNALIMITECITAVEAGRL